MTYSDKITGTLKAREYFSDFLTSFKKHPVSGALGRVVNAESVKQSIRNLVFTTMGERPFRPEVGSNVRAAMFQPSTLFAAESIARYVRDCIAYSEPRVRIETLSVVADVDGSDVRLSLTFSLVNDPEPISLSLIVKRPF